MCPEKTCDICMLSIWTGQTQLNPFESQLCSNGSPATYAPCVAHVLPMSGPCVLHVWPMCGPCVLHVWPMCGPCVAHGWPMCRLLIAPSYSSLHLMLPESAPSRLLRIESRSVSMEASVLLSCCISFLCWMYWFIKAVWTGIGRKRE